MDISSDPGVSLMLRQGTDLQDVGLSTLKDQAKTDQQVVAMVMANALAPPSDPNRGQNLDIQL